MFVSEGVCTLFVSCYSGIQRMLASNCSIPMGICHTLPSFPTHTYNFPPTIPSTLPSSHDPHPHSHHPTTPTHTLVIPPTHSSSQDHTTHNSLFKCSHPNPLIDTRLATLGLLHTLASHHQAPYKAGCGYLRYTSLRYAGMEISTRPLANGE